MSGCAKTTTAMKSITHLPLSQWICIAYTHSAVNNLRNIFSSLSNLEIVPRDNFMTIHRFLQIPVNTNGDYSLIKRKQLKYLANLIIVDEFSLIPLDIIDYLFELSVSANVDMVFVGDFVQLMPISLTREPISLNLLSSDFSNINMSFNEAIRIADHLSNSVYTSKYFETAQKMILLHNYRNGSKVNQVLNDALDYKFDKSMGAADNNIISLLEISKYVNDGYIVLSSTYSLLEQAYIYTNPIVGENEFNKLKNTRIGKIKIDVADKLVLLENLDNEFVNGDEVIVKSLIENGNEIEIIKNYPSDSIEDNFSNTFGNELSKHAIYNNRIVDANKILPYNFITCHKAQGRTIPKVLLILDDLFEITMLYTAITRARDDIKFIKFKHLPSKSDIEAFKIMRDVIYKLPNDKIKSNEKRLKKRKKIEMRDILNIDYKNVCMNDDDDLLKQSKPIQINQSIQQQSKPIQINQSIQQQSKPIQINQSIPLSNIANLKTSTLINLNDLELIQSINYSNVHF